MMHKEPVRRSFLRGKPFGPALPSLSAYDLPTSLLPAASWPPSLVPTWQTTAWAGVCFSRLTSSGLVIMRRRDVSPRVASVLPVSHCRELAPLGARARAPPRSLHAGKGRLERGCNLYSCIREYRESQTLTRRRNDARKTRLGLRSPYAAHFIGKIDLLRRSRTHSRPC